MNTRLPLTLLVHASLLGAALAGTLPAPEPVWRLSEDGGLVIHVKSGTAWKRCAEGMNWTGKACAGQALLLTQADALALASEAQADGVRWRLPRVTELQRLARRGGSPPGLDADLFPGGPRQWHWASTANVKLQSVNPYNYGNVMKGVTGDNVNQMGFLHGWSVNLETGEAQGETPKRQALPVRLVHTLPSGRP
jgi:hypothetical protein